MWVLVARTLRYYVLLLVSQSLSALLFFAPRAPSRHTAAGPRVAVGGRRVGVAAPRRVGAAGGKMARLSLATTRAVLSQRSRLLVRDTSASLLYALRYSALSI